MSISVKEVENLNKRIEKINLDYTRKKTQQELLKERLDKEIKEYKDEFGVDLSGKSPDKIKKKITEEHKKVVKKVEEEYRLKLQVVQAIEEGDYESAGRLLGIEENTSEIEEEFMDEDTIEESVHQVEVSEELFEEDTSEDVEEVDFGFDADELEINNDDNSSSEEESELAISVDEESETEDGNLEEESVLPGFDEDDEDEGETVSEEVSGKSFMSAVRSKSEVLGSSVKDAFEDIEDNSDNIFPNIDVSGLEVSDDDDEEVDFGFGDMLSGTKFDN